MEEELPRVHGRAKIDVVVGADRLTLFADRPAFPYIECVMSECLRWATPLPLGWLAVLLIFLLSQGGSTGAAVLHRFAA